MADFSSSLRFRSLDGMADTFSPDTEINTGLCLNWSSVNRAGYIAYMNTKLDVVVGLVTLIDTAPE